MQIILVVKKLELCHFEFNVATYITQRCSKLKKKTREIEYGRWLVLTMTFQHR